MLDSRIDRYVRDCWIYPKDRNIICQ